MNRPNNQYGRNNNFRHRSRDEETKLPDFQTKWITEGANDSMIDFVEKLGKKLKAKGVSASQLRNIYGEIMRIKLKGYNENQTDFKLLKPKVAYNYGRINNKREKDGFKEFVDVFNQAHNSVKDEKSFENFQKFFEAILAYHKYYGGK